MMLNLMTHDFFSSLLGVVFSNSFPSPSLSSRLAILISTSRKSILGCSVRYLKK